MKNLILIALLLLTACGSQQDTRFICNCEQKKEVQRFIEAHIKDANNMSDEEMEDVIVQLQRTAISVTCTQRLFWIIPDGNRVDWTKTAKLDSCETIFY